MGNAPSKTPGATAGADKKVNRRTSIQALSGSKAPAADPSHSRESATGHHAALKQQTPVHQRLQSRTVETPMGSGGGERLERHNSRKHREGDQYDLPIQSRGSQAVHPPQAVQVPDNVAAYRDQGEASTPRPVNIYYANPSNLTRPPRLPLPIGDAMTAPGSPITSGSLGAAMAFDKTNLEVSSEKSELDPAIDEDDVVQDELDSIVPTGFNKSVPTTIDWRGGGEKVYVTGTFVNWARKFKLHKSDIESGLFTTVLQLRPGTHHLKFIVDGTMRTSDQLPTAVDFTNHLVNYIEISADEIERPRRESDKPPKVIIPPEIFPPKVLPESLPIDTTESPEESDKEEPEEEIPMGDFRNIIPQFLVDIDRNEDGQGYHQAANVIRDSRAPPMLPLFLARSILNSTTPMKDDNSVLNYPNHTVLNHLATSSIKNGVLATSVTTRYKRKYVTTILYKPTGPT
ncbi:galactose metabolism-related protein [Microsporum ferrugineum]